MRDQRYHSRNGTRELLPWYLSGWLFLGALWGVVLGDASRHANENYDRVLGALEAHDAFNTPYYAGFAFDATMIALAIGLLVLFFVYLLVGLLAFARRRSFWLTVLGVFVGIGASGTMHHLYVAFGLFGRG